MGEITPLRACRTKAKLTMKEVCDAIERDLPKPYHVSISTMGRWEQMGLPLDPVIGLYLAGLFGCDLTDLDPTLPEAIAAVRALVSPGQGANQNWKFLNLPRQADRPTNRTFRLTCAA